MEGQLSYVVVTGENHVVNVEAAPVRSCTPTPNPKLL